jgi:hypothetical protein
MPDRQKQPGKGMRRASAGAKKAKPSGSRAARKTSSSKGNRARANRRRRSPAAAVPVAAAASAVLIVNIIPRSMSIESEQDSEPHLTVNPANPDEIVATAFTPDPGGSAHAPIFVSMDGGSTWTLNASVPSQVGFATGDITTSFSGKGRRLYAGILNGATRDLQLLGTADAMSATPMKIFQSRGDADQPFINAATVKKGPDKGRERVYIGVNDFKGLGGRTATIDHSLHAGAASPSFTSTRIETRATSGQNGAQIRPVAHGDGTIYAIYYGWRATTGNFAANTFRVTSADVVVVRDDKWGNGPKPFQALADPNDNLPGLRVARGLSFPFMRNGTDESGHQRLGGTLSIAVDPANSANAYISYGERPASGSIMTLHLRRSTDRGTTWSADLLTIRNATNGAVAVSGGGVIAFLYQQLVRTTGVPRWRTVLQRSTNGINWNSLVLADTPVDLREKKFDPHLGDYVHLLALNRTFYGVFSASNRPDMTRFPSGVKFQRNADFTTRKLLRLDNTTEVKSSIDPFFFRVADI